ncbi:MAG: NAD(P)H-dependent oxidoreductase [Tannerella sp.]|jgi:NAD(P)H-dependent FMN reductase|nr:NAD(P)H-dependent oxidoreductase [Tannerella sp.]
MSRKIVAFAGSNSSKSINKKLVRFVLTYFKEYEQNLLDLNDYEMDIFSIDREENGYPDQVYAFRNQIEGADIIICSLAENNGSYSAAFKNVFDWCSRIDLNIFRNKPMFLMSSSPGRRGGSDVMSAAKSRFPGCGADIMETFSLPSFNRTFEEDKGIIEPDLLKELEQKIVDFKEKIGQR